MMEKIVVGVTLREMIAEVHENGIRAQTLEAASRLREDIGLDSVALVDLMVALEQRFGLFVDPLCVELVDAFETVGSLETFVCRQLEGA